MFIDPLGLALLRQYVDDNKGTVTWDDKTKTATATVNGITKSFTAGTQGIYINKDNRIVVPDDILKTAFMMDYTQQATKMLETHGAIAAAKGKLSGKSIAGDILTMYYTTLVWFTAIVIDRTAGGWDLKSQPAWEAAMPGAKFLHHDDYIDEGEYEQQFLVNGLPMGIPDLTNINFGYTGTMAGISRDTLLIHAGAAQLRKDEGLGLFASIEEAKRLGPYGGYGDQPDDYRFTNFGIDWVLHGFEYAARKWYRR